MPCCCPQVARCNEAIDAHASEMHERTDPALRNTKAGTPLAGDGKSGRLDMSGMLGWPDPQCTPFRELLAHPKLVPMLHKLVGQGYRLDHLPLLIAQNKGSEGFHLHGGQCFCAWRRTSATAMSAVMCGGDGGQCRVLCLTAISSSPPSSPSSSSFLPQAR